MNINQNIATYLSLNGIPTKTPTDPESIFFMRDPQGAWYPNRGNHFYNIDNICVELHDALEEKIFGSKEDFYFFLRYSPEFLSTAGMNSEAPISKSLFELLLTKLPKEMPVNKALYLFDCRKLVSGIQECSKEVMQLQGEFYQVLNLEELFFPHIPEDDGIRYVTSPTVTKLYALLGFIYVRLHSLLDYVTKLAIEIENLRKDFDTYPRMASKNMLYSDRKRLTFNGKEGTLFEKCALITEVETIRNHIIHDGFLDDMPKAYRVISNGVCIEKFVLFPDRCNEGRLDTFKNRNLFYGNEDKINLRLPMLVETFQTRLLMTLRLLIQSLS